MNHPMNGQPAPGIPGNAFDVPPLDPGNPILSQGPALWTTVQVQTPQGKRLAVTIRTTSTTLTLLLGREDAARMGGDIVREAGRMSALIVPGALG